MNTKVTYNSPEGYLKAKETVTPYKYDLYRTGNGEWVGSIDATTGRAYITDHQFGLTQILLRDLSEFIDALNAKFENENKG